MKTGLQYCLGLLLCLCAGMLTAHGKSIVSKNYSVKDGMTDNAVKAICQDKNGYIWIGTKNGLNRLDGYDIGNYYHEASRQVRQPNDIVSIDALSDGLFWIGTFGGVVLFDPASEQYVDIRDRFRGKHYPSSIVTGVAETSAGDVIVATKQGLYRFLAEGHCDVVDGYEESYIHNMTSVSDREVILDIYDKGIYLYDIMSGRSVPLLEGRRGFTVMKGIRDRKGMVWLAGDLNDIYLYDPRNRSLTRVSGTADADVAVKDNYVHDIMEYDDGLLLLSTDKGVVLYDKERRYLYMHPSLPATGRVMSAYRDKAGNLWIGTFSEGAYYFYHNDSPFKHYTLTSRDGESLQAVGRPMEWNGSLLIGHSKGLVVMSLADPDKVETLLDSDSGSIGGSELYFASQVGDDRMMLYFLNRGDYGYYPSTGAFTPMSTTLDADDQIRAAVSDADGNMWLAANDLVVIRADKDEADRNLSTNYGGATRHMLTQDIVRRGNSMIVGARTSGIWVFDYAPKSYEHYFKGVQPDVEELKDINVSVIFDDSKGNVWIGTYDAGVYRWRPETDDVLCLNVASGLVHNSVCAIAENPANGDIYVASINGLTKISGGRTVAVYDSDSGFPLDEVSPKSMLFAGNGRLYIGGSNGIAEFDPSLSETSVRKVEQVRISLLETLDDAGSPGHLSVAHPDASSDISLTYDNSSVRIAFSVLDFAAPKGYRYAYRLLGLDDEWHEIDHNEVIYSNLRAGSYVFEVRTRDLEGQWSETVTSLPFKVRPAVWATWWAKLLYVFFIISFIVILVLYLQHRKTTRHRQEIERIEKENIRREFQNRIELFTSVSHEFRTPLTLISGPIDDLMDDPRLPDSLRPMVRKIQRNTGRLMLLVNQLLDFRKFEHGSMRLRLSRVFPSEFMEDQIDTFRDLASRHDIDIIYTDTYGNDGIWADSDLMSKVVFNLISNAIKHSPDGGAIEVSTSSEEDGKWMVFCVRDHGDGIDASATDHIFEPFFQTGGGQMKGMAGSGIGLSLVKYVVSLHRGEVYVRSRPGEGAAFYVRLRTGLDHFKDCDVSMLEVREDDNVRRRPQGQVAEDIERQTVRDSSRPTVLVVEDDVDLRDYVAGVLADAYNVISAPDGQKGLVLAESEIPDLILSDIVMPVMDGLELCKAVKDNQSTAHIPVILLTARSLDDQILEGYESMADDYIVKPFKSRILKAKIASVLLNRAKVRESVDRKLTEAEVPVEEIKREDPFLRELIDLITEYASDSSLTTETLYTSLGISRTQFFRKIKSVSDLSPNKLILNIRMKMAVEKFKEKGMTISEVAYAVGFSDPAYFSKTFKGVFGCTPSEYISEMRSATELKKGANTD